MPRIKGICKRLLVRIAQDMHNLAQFLARFKFRSPREVACDNSFLMKLTHLHWQISKKVSYSRPAINYDSLEREALPLKRISCAPILIDCFTFNFAPIDIAAIVSITNYEITT